MVNCIEESDFKKISNTFFYTEDLKQIIKRSRLKKRDATSVKLSAEKRRKIHDMKIKLGKLVRDDLGNVFRVIEETRHWQSPDELSYTLYQKGEFEGRTVCCSADGQFHSGYNGHGTKIIGFVEEV